MPFSEDTIKDIHDAVRIAHERQFWLFRGHPRDDYQGKLVPKVFRNDLSKRLGELKSNSGYESELASSFKNAAPSVYSRCPADGEHLRWLALMQHYGAPTRLLDWSQSILVALFFCVEEDIKAKCKGKGGEEDVRNEFVDGEVWAMNAVRLTDLVRSKLVKDHENERACITQAAMKLAQQAMADERFWSKDKCSEKDCCKYPLAFGPPLEFPRITSQQSWFTIHPQPAHEITIGRLLGEDSLIRYVVPAKSKKGLRESLAALGIARRALFPDLDGLAGSLVSEKEREMRARDRFSTGGDDSAL